MTRTVFQEESDAGDLALRWRRAVTETRGLLKKADATWSRHGCPASGECCQLAVTKRAPWLWPSEWKVLLERLKRDKREVPSLRDDGACPFLDASGKRCSVYEDRPFGCRTFFCHRITGPSKQPATETNHLLERIRDANIAADETATPREMREWVADWRAEGFKPP